MSNVNGASSAVGHYNTTRQWLRAQATTPLHPVSGDVLCGFDNDQVIGKQYHVRSDQELKTSVITSVAVAQIDPEGKLQEQEALKPGNWPEEPVPEKVRNTSSDIYKDAEKVRED